MYSGGRWPGLQPSVTGFGVSEPLNKMRVPWKVCVRNLVVLWNFLPNMVRRCLIQWVLGTNLVDCRVLNKMCLAREFHWKDVSRQNCIPLASFYAVSFLLLQSEPLQLDLWSNWSSYPLLHTKDCRDA